MISFKSMHVCQNVRLSTVQAMRGRLAPELRVSLNRCLSCSSSHSSSKKKPHVKPPGKMKLFAEKRYMSLTERMERKLESNYPKAHKLFVLVKNGMKTFFADTKTLYRVSTELWKGKKPADFSYAELEVYRQMPHDMMKVFPVLAIAALPFAPYVIFPIAYIFPRHLLCRHFWTIEQQTQFSEHYLRTRVPHYTSVLHYMDKHSGDVKDVGHRRLLQSIISKLEQKGHPSAEEIIAVKPVFRDDQPFGRAFLASRHKLETRHLAKCFDLSTWSPARMSQQALLLHNIDRALLQHGVNSLTPVLTQQACFLRGLNAAKCCEADMVHYLKTWLQVSQHTDESSLSLLLHSPMLLALNHPANVSLLKR